MRILLDAQLPPTLARWLNEQGNDARPVREVGLRDAADEEIWRYAAQHGWAIMTKDEDFAQRAREAPVGPCIIWLRLGNCSNRALQAWLDPRLRGITQLVEQGSRLIEVI